MTDVVVKYKLGHSYSFEYLKDLDMYCPNCGERTVYFEHSVGDYYVGATHVCISCSHSWTIQGPQEANSEDEQVIEQIKRDENK